MEKIVSKKKRKVNGQSFHTESLSDVENGMGNEFEQIWQKFLTKLEAEIAHSSQADVARRLGVNRGQVSKWLSGLQVGGNLKTFITHVNKLGISMEELLADGSASETKQPAEIKNLRPNAPTEPAYVLKDSPPPDSVGAIVNVYAGVGAGAALDRIEKEPMAQISIPMKYAIASLFVVLVEGDSMEPTIHKGAYVGLDRSAQKIIQGEVYGVNLPYEGVVLKRVYVDYDNEKLVLKSDNPSHAAINLPIDGREGLIVGQAIWVMQDV